MKVPVAVNCWVVPSGTDAVAGATASETRAALVTVRVEVPLMPESVAVMVVDPGALLVAIPTLEMVAALVFDELQVEELVRSLLVWSLYVPVALNCCPRPVAMVGAPGVIEIVCKTADPVLLVGLPPPPHPANTPTHRSAIKIWHVFIKVFPLVTLVTSFTGCLSTGEKKEAR